MVDASKIEAAANALRDAKNWLAVFKTEYDINDEAINKLHEKLDEVGEKIGQITD